MYAEDHPFGDEKNRPDFLLSCNEFDIRCEHKLDSDLGNSQLERYLKLPDHRPGHQTHVVLITNRSLEVSPGAIGHARFLRPSDSSRHYFHWEDFYPVIAAQHDRLSQDFARFMRHLGMAPFRLPGDWADLRKDATAATRLDGTLMDTRAFFQKMGAHCRGGLLNFEVRHPLDWLHLLYISVENVATPFVADIEPPFLIARFYVPESEVSRIRHLKTGDVPCNSGPVLGRTTNRRADWNKSLILSYECVGSLRDHIAESTLETRENFLGFAQAVFEHVTNPPA